MYCWEHKLHEVWVCLRHPAVVYWRLILTWLAVNLDKIVVSYFLQVFLLKPYHMPIIVSCIFLSFDTFRGLALAFSFSLSSPWTCSLIYSQFIWNLELDDIIDWHLNFYDSLGLVDFSYLSTCKLSSRTRFGKIN